LKINQTRFYGFFAIFLFSGLIAGCDLFDNSMAGYFLDNTGIVEVTGVGSRPNYTDMDNGVILIPPADIVPVTVLEAAVSNPRNLAVRYELLGVPSGRDITIRQAESTVTEVLIKGAVLDDEYGLTIAMKSADGLRNFVSYDMRIRCVAFDTGLSDLRINDTQPLLDPNDSSFTVELPYQAEELALEGMAVDSAATLTLFRGPDAGGTSIASGSGRVLNSVSAPISVGENLFYLEVRRAWAVQGYTIKVIRLPNTSKDITEFYFTLGGKKYGAGSGTEGGSGSISGTNVTVTVPYKTPLGALAASVRHTGLSITPNPSVPRNYNVPVFYTVNAANGTTRTYRVTVTADPGITISGITVSGLNALTFNVPPAIVPPNAVASGIPITITISGGTPTWKKIYISGPEPVTPLDNTNSFTTPSTPGFYNVNVIATVGGIDYSGSFGLIVN
jgi:hypothetical protein